MIDKWYRYWYKAYLFLKLRVRPFQSHCFEDVFPLPIVSWRGIGLLVSYGEVCFLTARSQWDIGANLQVHNFWDFQPISISTWHLHFKIFGALLTWKLDGICGVFFHTCHLKTWPPRPYRPSSLPTCSEVGVIMGELLHLRSKPSRGRRGRERYWDESWLLWWAVAHSDECLCQVGGEIFALSTAFFK